MKGDVFKPWILDLNRQFQRQGRRILLLLDNAMPHSVEDYEDQLTNITVSVMHCSEKELEMMTIIQFVHRFASSPEHHVPSATGRCQHHRQLQAQVQDALH